MLLIDHLQCPVSLQGIAAANGSLKPERCCRILDNNNKLIPDRRLDRTQDRHFRFRNTFQPTVELTDQSPGADPPVAVGLNGLDQQCVKALAESDRDQQ